MWDPSNEAFGMTGPGGLQGPPALLQHALGSIVMHVVRGEHGDPAMAMFGVVPREERSAEGDRGGDVVEAAREAGVVLQGLELRLGEGWTLLTKVETSCDRILIAGGANVEAEWEQGPAV